MGIFDSGTESYFGNATHSSKMVNAYVDPERNDLLNQWIITLFVVGFLVFQLLNILFNCKKSVLNSNSNSFLRQGLLFDKHRNCHVNDAPNVLLSEEYRICELQHTCHEYDIKIPVRYNDDGVSFLERFRYFTIILKTVHSDDIFAKLDMIKVNILLRK